MTPTTCATTYEGIRRVRNLVVSLAEVSEQRLWMELRDEGANPYYNQTASGLFLELYYGLPSTLWTPWGKFLFGGSGSGDWRPIVETVLSKTGAVCVQQGRQTDIGHFGPYYALKRVGDLQLPLARAKRRSEFIPYRESVQQWEAMVDTHGPLFPSDQNCVRSLGD